MARWNKKMGRRQVWRDKLRILSLVGGKSQNGCLIVQQNAGLNETFRSSRCEILTRDALLPQKSSRQIMHRNKRDKFITTCPYFISTPPQWTNGIFFI